MVEVTPLSNHLLNGMILQVDYYLFVEDVWRSRHAGSNPQKIKMTSLWVLGGASNGARDDVVAYQILLIFALLQNPALKFC